MLSPKLDIYIIGAGGHARVVLDIILKSECWNFRGFITNSDERELHGYPVTHEDEFLNDKRIDPANTALVIGVGENYIRQKIYNKFSECEFQFPSIVSSSAIVSDNVFLNDGCVVMPGAIINTGASIGMFSVVNTGAVIDHDCKAGDFTSLSPSATLCGNVVVEEGAFIGAGASVSHGVKIGEWSVIGGGAFVKSDVEPLTLVCGVPAKTIGSRQKIDPVL